jgi:peptidyl-tRNA hydrolase, PTH1 family
VKLIVGLGNPGRKYELTRHNLGFMLIDRLAARSGANAPREDCDSLVQKVVLADKPCLLAKPQTYMNLSGQAVSRLIAKHYIDVARDLIVVSDDVALPVGRLRMRARGSAGGHNGLKSIIAQLGSQDFARLRLGIQPETITGDLADFVLARFESAEREIVDSMLERAEEAVIVWLQEGTDRAMAFTNKQALKPE